MKFPALLIFGAAALAFAQTPSIGPEHGSLLIAGGGRMGPEIVSRFIQLAGGVDAPMVIVPTADGKDPAAPGIAESNFLRRAGVKNITILHTNDRAAADSDAFVAPLRKAGGVWFNGGRQWRLVDSYLNTRTHRELMALLDRGGVIGGSSAGATIQGSYLVRGARAGPHIMMAPGYEQGLAFLRGVAIDQHLLKRKRENDMVEVIRVHPELLGIGLDEGTAILVKGDQFEVIGESKVAIYDKNFAGTPDGKAFFFLTTGDRFDMKTRRRIP